MNLTDELEKLAALHKGGSLTDQEFAQAKQKLLAQEQDSAPAERTEFSGPDSVGEAANRYVTFQMVMGVIGVIVFLIFLFGVILPHIPGNNGPFGH